MTKRILTVALAALMLLTLAFTASAATQVSKVEVRGTVFSNDTNSADVPSWDATTFAGFYYDIKYDRKTETLSLINTMENISSRTIDKEELWYNTTKALVDFKAYEKESVTVDDSQNYSLVGWQAEKWIAVNGKANKLAKLAYEMSKDEKKTLTTGETWSLGAGYELTINAIDARTTPRQVWFTLKKDGAVIDEGIGQAPEGSETTQKQKAVYTKTKTIQGESDALLFAVYVDTIFSGATSDMVQFKYAWLIDESTAKEIKSADKFGVFEVRSATDTAINLSNENTVSLSKNTVSTIMGDIKFKVADNNTLRFYPMVEQVIGEGGEVPGVTVTGATPKPTVTAKANVTTTLTAVPTKPAEVATPEKTAAPAATTPKEPGFEAVFAIAGLLAVAYIVLRQRK